MADGAVGGVRHAAGRRGMSVEGVGEGRRCGRRQKGADTNVGRVAVRPR